MKVVDFIFDTFIKVFELGGPVVIILIFISILTLSVILYKIYQFFYFNIGYHKPLIEALKLAKKENLNESNKIFLNSRNIFSSIILIILKNKNDNLFLEKITSLIEIKFSKLEEGLKIVDLVIQIAPLMGLLGTVLGMIDAFQSLQSAGSQVDPSDLAGGIWVALLTTAIGLSIAIPSSIFLSWFESKIEKERIFLNFALSSIYCEKIKIELGFPQNEKKND